MKTIEAQNPDVVLIVGDFVDDDTTKEDMIRCCAALGEIKTTYGVYISLSLPVADKITSTEHEQKRSEKQVNLVGVKVILAEDNELNREIAKVLLEDEKMIVTEVCDGRQALETFAENPTGTFDLILMDVMMPVMGGLEAAREIRSSGKEDAKMIPIFAMTANAFTEDRQQTREAGMNERIAKPLDAKLLMRKIMEYCKRRDA